MASTQVILITGSSTGFGRQAAEVLARKGHTVYASMRGVSGKNKPYADALAELARRESLRLHAIELDVTNEAQVNAAVESITAKEGRLDTVVNNAGIFGMGLTETYTLDQARQMYETNVFGPLALIRAALPVMRRQRSGLFVHITSGVGRFTVPGMGLYASTKWALEALGESLRYEGSAIGVDSVMIEPGAFRTEIFGKHVDPKEPQRAQDYGPLAAIGETFGNNLAGYFQSEYYRGPEIVVDAIVQTIEAKPGTRALRIPVGADTAGVAAMNAESRVRQQELLEAFGLPAFKPLA
jgi:NAD(P)-dependent dehydrogenase (short-subunit alcohol dehydrogenase family)